MRAQCAFDRSTLGVHIQGATAERGGAVGSRHPGARTGSDGSDEAARSKQMFTTSVYGLTVPVSKNVVGGADVSLDE